MINTYTVQPNETIVDIAKKFNLTVNDFEKVNNINLNSLTKGQVINIPVDTNDSFVYYQVNKGDTLSDLSRKIGMSVDYFSKINGLLINEYLYPGQILIIPKPGIKVYITEDVESLNDISNKLGVDVNNILNNNKNIFLSKEQLILYR